MDEADLRGRVAAADARLAEARQEMLDQGRRYPPNNSTHTTPARALRVHLATEASVILFL